MTRILTFFFVAWNALGLAADAPRPDIVFFLVDDLGYADCGFNGGTDIHTPQIDALARSGAILTAHYVQPVCSPTRAALMTGRYATRTGVYTIVRPHARWGLPLEERTLANALKDAGYTTAITGKWHLGEFARDYLPTRRGFDHQYGHYFGALDYFTKKRGNDIDWYRNDEPVRESGYTTHLVTSEACRLIEAQPADKPLFLYVPFNAVHSPLQVPDEYLKPYGALSGGRKQLAGMLSAADEAIGKIVAALEKSGRRDRTLIVFSADNGGPRPGTNTPLHGFKGSLFEGGVRGCAFATWPGRIPAGQRIDHPVHIIDWYPTLVTLAGGTLSQKLPLDGKDLWPMLTQRAGSPHDEILCVQSPGRAALRVGDWKLIVAREAAEDPEEGEPATRQNSNRPANRRRNALNQVPELALFNLARDLGETTNLADQEPDRVASMKSRLSALLKDAVSPGNR